MTQGRDTLVTGQRALFIEHLAKTSNVTGACEVAGISRSAAYRLKQDDEAFSKDWDDAIETATDALESEARRRALEGTEEYITCKDGLVYGEDGKPVMQRKYSDAMMTLLLKAHRGDKFKDRQQVDVSVTDLSSRMDEARKRARGES